MAGLIPEAFIHDLLARTDIVDIIDARVQLKKAGRNYTACCPFHKEKTPSFSVSPDKQFYYCFGCGASGDAIGFVKDFDHIDFVDAVELLARHAGLEVPRENSREQAQQERQQPLYHLMEQATQYYQSQLKEHPSAPQALAYLQQRGLDPSTCTRFGIGYAPPGWDNLSKALTNGNSSQAHLLSCGMLIEAEDSGRRYDRFRERIMFPIRDNRGRVIAFGGRVLGDAKPKYLNSPETPLFHKGRELYGLYEVRQANRQLDQLLVVEGYMDVVALSQHGINHAIATLGTACTVDHVQRIFKLVNDVIFCFDGDEAGRRAAWRALEATLPQMEGGHSASFLFLPQGEDPDSIVQKEGREGFLNRLQHSSIELADFLFQQLEQGLDMTTLNGRNRLASLVQPYLQQLKPGLYRQLLQNRLADITGVDSSSLEQVLAPPQPESGSDVLAPSKPKTLSTPYREQRPPAKQERLSSLTVKQLPGRAIQLLLQQPSLAHDTDLSRLPQSSSSQPDVALLSSLLNSLSKQPERTTCYLLGQWQGTPEGERLYHLAQGSLSELDNIEREFIDTMERLFQSLEEQQTSNFVEIIRSSNLSYKDQQVRQQIEALKAIKLSKLPKNTTPS